MASPGRIVHHGDGTAFLASGRLPHDHAVFTSLPDHSELPHLGVPGWRTWFVDTVTLVCRAIADDAVAVFYQTDVKHDGHWIDKGHLVLLGADAAGSGLHVHVHDHRHIRLSMPTILMSSCLASASSTSGTTS